MPSSAERRLAKLAAMWGRRLACHENADLRQAGRLPHEEEADRLVYELYRLSTEEIARVESHFLHALARAA